MSDTSHHSSTELSAVTFLLQLRKLEAQERGNLPEVVQLESVRARNGTWE